MPETTIAEPQGSGAMTPHRIAKILQVYNDDERDVFIKVMQEEDDEMGFFELSRYHGPHPSLQLP
jgi:hypothetical protein